MFCSAEFACLLFTLNLSFYINGWWWILAYLPWFVSNLSSVMPVKSFLPHILWYLLLEEEITESVSWKSCLNFKTNSSAGTTEHSLNILFILVLRLDLVIQENQSRGWNSQKHFPVKEKCLAGAGVSWLLSRGMRWQRDQKGNFCGEEFTSRTFLCQGNSARDDSTNSALFI